MAEPAPPSGAENSASAAPAAGPKPDAKASKPLKPPNPMWKYMGLGENFRPRLPSRNWTIFLTIVGSFSAAVIYDKREKNRVQRKWCKLVEHLAKEPLDPRSMPRKLSIFLEAPPADGLRVSQDHFKLYVKPVLVASGLDWEFIQGREEGDIRAKLAEQIRNSRLPLEERSKDDPVAGVRQKSGIKEFEGLRGDIVIGRHTWKEYVRGLHEGWLGPVKEPAQQQEEQPLDDSQHTQEGKEEPLDTLPGISIDSTPRDADPPSEEPKKPARLPPFISTNDYELAAGPVELPDDLDPSAPISFPHILGFLNTPRRFYRFLTRRELADSIGRDTAAIILSTYRPYHATPSSPVAFPSEADEFNTNSEQPPIPQEAEQQLALVEEEKAWHKSVRVHKDDEPERTWLDPVVLDPRIASRMRRAELTPEDEARANKIVVTEEEIEGWVKGGIRRLGRKGWAALGFGKEKKSPIVEGDEAFE